MEPKFSRKYNASVKVFKPGPDKTFISSEESICVAAQDFFDAYQKAQQYIKILVVNNDWRFGEVIYVSEDQPLFIGINLNPAEQLKESYDEPMGLPDPPILQKGFRGMPCCGIDDGDWGV